MKNATREIVLKRHIDTDYYLKKIIKIVKCVIVMSILVFVFTQYLSMKSEIEDLKNQVQKKKDEIVDLTNSYKELKEINISQLFNANILKENENILLSTIDDLNKEIADMTDKSKNLETEYDSLYSEYKKLSERSELYDKYEYAIIYDGERTKLTYDNIKYGEELMKEKGYDPNIMFGIMGAESGYDPNTKNSESTATGLGQILRGTGKWVYEDYMGNGSGSYNHSMALNPYTNMDLMANYLDYLLKKNDGDLYTSIVNYRGKGGDVVRKYIDKINSILGDHGNIYKISMNLKNSGLFGK